MNMRAVYRWLTSKLGWSVSAFVTYCCFCGTDFTDPQLLREGKPKRLLFNGISPQTVFEACKRFEMQSFLEATASNLRAFVMVVRAVYSHVFTHSEGRMVSCLGIPKETREHWKKKLDGKKPFKLATLRRMPVTPKLAFPTDAQLKEVFAQIQFNLRCA